MINISDENSDENTSKNANKSDFAFLSCKQGQWGSYHMKPTSQHHWDKLVKKAAQTIVDTPNLEVFASAEPTNIRPHLFDSFSGNDILIDTGATCSIWPKSRETTKIDHSRGLKAVNGQVIRTYGTKPILMCVCMYVCMYLTYIFKYLRYFFTRYQQSVPII